MDNRGVKNMIAAIFSIAVPVLLFKCLANSESCDFNRDQITNPIEFTQSNIQSNERKKYTMVVEGKSGEIRNIELDDYLAGVLLCEMPANFETEALKAQAIAARTYALHSLKKLTGKHGEAAVCMDPGCCQGYWDPEEYISGGGTEYQVEKARYAVSSTDDLVIVYNGELIEATYFSCSGGITESAVEVWGNDVPYLQAVESPGEQDAVHYTDTLQFSCTEVLRILELQDSDSIVINDVTYTIGGGIKEIAINGHIFTGNQIRSLLGLPSTIFAATVLGNTVTITTKGFGHRVGLSQYGANAMAKTGATYSQILAHYYQGIELISLTCIND